MRPNLYRQLRFVVILVAGIGILTTLVALVIVYRSELLQREFLDSLVNDEYHELLEHLEQYPDAPLPKASQLQIWVDGHPKSEEVPEELRSLAPGTYHDVRLGQNAYHVLKTRTDGNPTYVGIETSSFSSRERWLQAALVGVALLDLPLALLMGIWLVKRISRPHEKLARRLGELDPSQEPDHIGQDFVGLEVEQIARAIDKYQDRLRGFIERERTFTAAASHELRTPLTSLMTSAEVLHYNRQLPQELQNYTRKLIRNATQMGEILDSLMWFAREIDKPRMEPLNLAATVGELAAQFPDSPVRLEVSEQTDTQALLPEALFAIVFTNLLKNACQYSTPNTEITVTVDKRKITITNLGTGIPKEKMTLMFQRNYRSEESSGQGLGLYIAANICARLNWKLRILSEEGVTAVSLEV